jgi:hypothetical protein
MNISNSEVALKEHARQVNDALERGKLAGSQSIEAFREAGRGLCAIKKVLRHGLFGKYVETECGCSRQWAGRLRKLHEDWDSYLAAKDWKQKSGRSLSSKAFTLDGALSLIREYRRAQNGGPKSFQGGSRKSLAERAHAELDAIMQAADAYARFLEEEVAKFVPAAPHSERETLTEEAKDMIEELAELWLRGATEDERFTAISGLYELAHQLGWSLRDLLRECGVDRKVSFPFARATTK